MGKTKGISPSDLKRNERKKRGWKDKNKIKRLQDERLCSTMQDPQAEALRYKKLAVKYIALWKGATKRNDNKVNIYGTL